MLKKYFNLVIFSLVLFSSLSSVANFTIMPVKIDINKNDKIATIKLQNNDLMERSFQLTVLKKEFKDGKEEYKETKDLVATPLMFKVQGGKIQIIRIAVKDKNKENISTAKNAYRISVKELVHNIKIDDTITSTVDFIVEFNVPITISS
ncbi:MAG TPA: fimbria/pilus periplasmic chaperone [Rickettsia endosymbiont of Bembidion nr. Transversale]|nr:fimbria/pilus periplasmic chaperone [Rickettsia endosymbiont of Bembidion nr. Transversale]